MSRRARGRLAQVARASGLHPGGRRFESFIAHHFRLRAAYREPIPTLPWLPRLETSPVAEGLRVLWSDGSETVIPDVEANQRLVIRQPDP